MSIGVVGSIWRINNVSHIESILMILSRMLLCYRLDVEKPINNQSPSSSRAAAVFVFPLLLRKLDDEERHRLMIESLPRRHQDRVLAELSSSPSSTTRTRDWEFRSSCDVVQLVVGSNRRFVRWIRSNTRWWWITSIMDSTSTIDHQEGSRSNVDWSCWIDLADQECVSHWIDVDDSLEDAVVLSIGCRETNRQSISFIIIKSTSSICVSSSSSQARWRRETSTHDWISSSSTSRSSIGWAIIINIINNESKRKKRRDRKSTRLNSSH